jgi:hypothetical protein
MSRICVSLFLATLLILSIPNLSIAQKQIYLDGSDKNDNAFSRAKSNYLLAQTLQDQYFKSWSVKEQERLTIELVVVPEDGDNTIVSSGKIDIGMNEFGRINMKFFGDGESFTISSTRPDILIDDEGDPQGTTVITEEILVDADIFLKPSKTPDGQLQLSGYIEKMVNAGDSKNPRFEFTEQVIPRKKLIEGQRDIILKLPKKDITLRAILENPQQNKKRQTQRGVLLDIKIQFDSEYSLQNSETGEYIIEPTTCSFNDTPDDRTRKNKCAVYTVYPAKNDSMVYYVYYGVDDIYYHDDDRVTFNLYISRTIASNYENFDPYAKRINFGEAYMMSQSRAITSQPGDTWEVILDNEPNFDLPFSPKEMIKLSFEVVR